MDRSAPTLIALLALAPTLRGAPIAYEKELLPILKDNCLSCHNKTTTKGGLNMESTALMLKGGDSGAALEPGKGDKSLVFLAAAGKWDSEMPPKGNKVGARPLDETELALLRRWIDEGAHQGAKVQREVAWEAMPASFGPVLAVAMSDDGQWTAAARGNQVRVHHSATGARVALLADPALKSLGPVAHGDVVQALQFTPDGSLVSGGYGEVKVWQLAQPKTAMIDPKSVLQAKAPDISGDEVKHAGKSFKHGAAISAAALSADGSRLATAGANQRLRLWEVASGKMLLEIQEDWAFQRGSLDLRAKAARAAVDASWAAEMQRRAEKESTDLAARLKKANELLAAGNKTLADAKKDLLAKQTAAASADKELKALPVPAKPDEASKKKETAAKDKQTKAQSDLKLAQEGLKRAEDALVDAKEEITRVNQAIVVADKAKAEAAAASVKAAALSKEQAAAVAARQKQQATALPLLGALAFAADGSFVVGWLSKSDRLCCWSTASGRPFAQLSLPKSDLQKLVLDCSSKPGSIRVGDAAAQAWELSSPLAASWTLIRQFGAKPQPVVVDRVNALALSPDGKVLAVGSGEPSRSGDISLWDWQSGKLLQRWDERHVDSVLSLAFSPDGKLLASGGADKALRITQLSDGRQIKVLEGHTHHVLSVSWRSDGKLLASSGADLVVKIWDWSLAERRRNVEGWDKEVTGLRYLGQGDVLATAAGDGKLRLFSSEGAESKGPASAGLFLQALGASRLGEAFAAGAEDGQLWVYDSSTGQALQHWKP